VKDDERGMMTTEVGSSVEREEELDGRRRRGSTSRARIVDAMLQLIREGTVTPGAAKVADLAGVSLRTVFRHFEEMDSLYKEIAESIQARVLPAFFRPYSAEAWNEKLLELLDRRIELYEAILPFKISGDLRRYQSSYLANDYSQHLMLEKMSLESVLPPELGGDTVLLHALRAAMGFQGWRILRHDLELDIPGARTALMRTVESLLATAQHGGA
jgi:AcrR family transcriptional regulator